MLQIITKNEKDYLLSGTKIITKDPTEIMSYMFDSFPLIKLTNEFVNTKKI